MLGFAAQTATTHLGRITLAGPSQISNFQHLNGSVDLALDSKGPQRLATWITRSDKLIDRVLDIISLAEGRMIRWSVRTLRGDGLLLQHEFFGQKPTTDPYDGLFSSLNLQPVLDLAVRRYTHRLKHKTGLGVAFEWFLQRPQYIELELLTAFTALEHLLKIFLEKNRGATNIPDKAFSELKKPLRKVLDRAVGGRNTIDREGMIRVRQKVLSANQGSLRQNVDAMLNFHGVPVTGLEERLKNAIDARNKIIHRGLYRGRGRADIYDHVAVIREVLKRFFLTMLRYKGNYHSMLNGPDNVFFPPTES